MYGFGDTPHPHRPLALDDYVDGVSDIIGETDVVLIGHSFGGRVAMRLAARDTRVRGLVLIDSAGIPPRRSPRYYSRVLRYKLAKRLGLSVKNAGSADYAALQGPMRKTFVNIVNDSNVSDARKISVPTLLLWGSADKDTPMYMCRRLKRLIRGSEAVVFPGAGHYSYIDCFDAAYRVIRAFCKTI